MLSGEFQTVPYAFIWVDRTDRIRKEITEDAISEKEESIRRIGLINPITIRRDGKLIAGETRWTAIGRIGWDRIPVQWVDELAEDDLLAIELEENIKRTDLTWQEQCDALRRFHQLKLRSEAKWSQGDTAKSIGLSPQAVAQQLAVATEIANGNERVIAAKEYSVARGITSRMNERKRHDEISLLQVKVPESESVEPVERETSPILNADFTQWVKDYSGQPFNFIHCDFPYGIGADKFNQGAADAYGGYEDSPDTYWNLVRSLVANKDKLLGSSGHILFWFSMRYYTETLAALSEHFWVDPYPLIWVKSDNKGTLPDPQRGPRRIYEVAFLCSHGDRKILSAVANTFLAPTVRNGEHMSEKNEDMLRHFMRMVVDDSTRMLDPTCGSGSSVRAAASLGAASVLGLEINPEFAHNARRVWNKTLVPAE